MAKQRTTSTAPAAPYVTQLPPSDKVGTYYQRRIIELSRCTLDEARRIESYMRIGHGTLSHLSAHEVASEVRMGLKAVRAEPIEWELCARSFGL